jgi:LPLT family lysophospholipid transporter-like MFS transporter
MRASIDASRASGGLNSRAMVAVLSAQFLSALGDNALLFAAIALLRSERYPDWSQPLLQEFFVAAYILLAPFVGPLADALPKGRVMLIANGLKLAGALGMAVGLDPFVAYGLVGIGAASYSPAKYGILSELTTPAKLVKANGLMEASTIAAILLGAVAGGKLADWNIEGGVIAVVCCYALAALANLSIPRLPPAHRLEHYSAAQAVRDFAGGVRTLLRVPDARFSIIGTSVFWGAGATLRFLLIAWVPVALGITTNSMPANLNGVVAVGIVIGAALASRFVTLAQADRALPSGVLIGVAVCLLATTSHLPSAFALMLLLGGAGGFFVVPLNALLQECGVQTVGAGHAIAVQNLAENAVMLVMIGLYTLIMFLGAPVQGVAAGFGIALALGIGALWRGRWSAKTVS